MTNEILDTLTDALAVIASFTNTEKPDSKIEEKILEEIIDMFERAGIPAKINEKELCEKPEYVVIVKPLIFKENYFNNSSPYATSIVVFKDESLIAYGVVDHTSELFVRGIGEKVYFQDEPLF